MRIGVNPDMVRLSGTLRCIALLFHVCANCVRDDLHRTNKVTEGKSMWPADDVSLQYCTSAYWAWLKEVAKRGLKKVSEGWADQKGTVRINKDEANIQKFFPVWYDRMGLDDIRTEVPFYVEGSAFNNGIQVEDDFLLYNPDVNPDVSFGPFWEDTIWAICVKSAPFVRGLIWKALQKKSQTQDFVEQFTVLPCIYKLLPRLFPLGSSKETYGGVVHFNREFLDTEDVISQELFDFTTPWISSFKKMVPALTNLQELARCAEFLLKGISVWESNFGQTMDSSVWWDSPEKVAGIEGMWKRLEEIAPLEAWEEIPQIPQESLQQTALRNLQELARRAEFLLKGINKWESNFWQTMDSSVWWDSPENVEGIEGMWKQLEAMPHSDVLP